MKPASRFLPVVLCVSAACAALATGALAADVRELRAPENAGVAIEPSHPDHMLTLEHRNFNPKRGPGVPGGVWVVLEGKKIKPMVGHETDDDAVGNEGRGKRAPSNPDVAVVHFDFNKTRILDEGRLTPLAHRARESGVNVKVIGHADETGTHAYNQRLSERRAAAVKAWLVREGVSPKRIATEGRGKRDPVDPNNAAANRRAEAKLGDKSPLRPAKKKRVAPKKKVPPAKPAAQTAPKPAAPVAQVNTATPASAPLAPVAAPVAQVNPAVPAPALLPPSAAAR